MTGVTTLRGIVPHAKGRQAGSIAIEHSDNRHDDGVIPVPVVTLPRCTDAVIALTVGCERH